MHFYEYICGNCQNQFEKLRKMVDRNEPFECDKCHSLADRNPNPSLISVKTKSLSSSKSLSVEKESIDLSGGAGIILPHNGKAYLKNCSVTGLRTGIIANGTKVRGENIHFENTETGIQHINADIELKNVTYKNTKKDS